MNSSSQTLREDFLTDNLWRLMVRLSVPGILGMLVVGINTFVDAIYVGQFIGKEALAAVALALPLTFLTNGMAGLVGVGSASVLSRAIGAEDRETQSLIFGNLVAMSLLSSLVMTIAGYFFAGELIAFMGGSGEIHTLGTQFLEISMLGSVFSIVGIAANMLVRGEGRIKYAMSFAVVAMVLNMCINPVLIKVLGLGIRGAALSTVIAMAVYSLISCLYFILGKSTIPVKPRFYGLVGSIAKPVLAIGSSSLIMQAMQLLQGVFVYKTIAAYGTSNDMAFMGATFRIFMLAVIPVFGIMQSFQPVVGVCYGARHYERVKDVTRVFGLGGMILLTTVWLVLELIPTMVLSLLLPTMTFTANDIFNFRLVLLALPGLPLLFIGITLFQAVGNAKLAAITMLARQIILFIPAILILPRFYGVDGVFYAMIGVDIVCIAFVVFATVLEFRKFDGLSVAKAAEVGDGATVETVQALEV